MASYYDQINGLAPKIWYRFNETAGTPVNSGSATSTLTSTGSPLLNEQTDVDGRAIYLNGSSHFSLSQMPAFTVFDDRSFTVETWFKTTSGFVDTQTSDMTLWNFRGRTTTGSTGNVVDFSLGIEISGTNKYKLNLGNSINTWNGNIISSQSVANNAWHHAVATYNTTSIKLYLNGQLVGTLTPNVSPARYYIDDSASHQGPNYKLIGKYDASAATYKGWIDEFAVYDYELTPQNILDNFNAGASVDFADIPGTASALIVMPTNSTETILTASPMTADATGAGHAASTIDLPKFLNTYMGELTLDTWFKFDINRFLENYGTGSKAGSNWTGTPINDVAGGIQGSGSISINGTDEIVQNGTQVPMASQCQDEDFTIGFWVKKLTKEATTYFFRVLQATGSDLVEFFWNADGGITFRINGNNTNHDVASTTDITDGEWHFVAGRLASSTMELFIDNVSIGTTTMNKTLTLTNALFAGGGSTDNISISQFFISTSANVGSTQIANIWDYGTPTSTQAAAYMPPANAKFNSAFNDYVQSKSPLFDFRMDEGSGVPANFGSAEITLSALTDPVGYTQNEAGLNTRTFKFTNRNQGLRGNYNLASGTMSSANVMTLGVLTKHNWKTAVHAHVAFGGTQTTNNGITINSFTDGTLRAASGNSGSAADVLFGTTDFADDKWHLIIVVQEASTLKLYVDGKLEASKTRSTAFTDTGQFAISHTSGANQGANSTFIKYVDEVFATNTAWTAQEVFEAYRALRLEMDTTATASLPMPTNIAGTGTTQSQATQTASSLFVMPTFITEQILDAAPGTASALFVLPNFGGNVVIDANYGHTAATASALFHNPQFQIGDFHSADHMDASALMVQPIIAANGAIVVSTAVTGDAIFVMPGIVTIKGARVFAEPARANAFLPLPPAYLQLTDDQWYVRLFAQHAQQNIEPKFITSSLPQSSTQIAKTVLKFFDDVTSSITVNNGYLENDLEEKIFKDPGSTDTSKIKIYPSIAANLTPTPALYTGYFDDFGRKAVRVENIEFAMPEEINNSQLPFSLEFSIKTTKANQIITQGKFASFTGIQRSTTALGLFNGKLYLMKSNTTSGTIGNRTPHPLNPDVSTVVPMLGRKNIADGQWHHIIIQIGYNDDRIQFWVDGQLDRQLIGGGRTYSRLYIMGSNNAISDYQSNFETSGWSYDKQAFIEETDVSLNYIGYLKYEPIKAEPMTATLTMTANNIASGNRGRAIVFYFWPQGNIAGAPPIDSIRGGETLDGITTDDYFRKPPQEWYGWDLFPIDVTGRYVSELVKVEAYGEANIKIQEPSLTILTGLEDPASLAYKVNTRGSLVDPVTDARRYIDVFNDIDLSKFDAIFFKNYPEETLERDAYTREEFADQYFNLREKTLFDNFIASLRKAIDTGISLFITNHQLAIDLGIIDRVEDVSTIYEQDFTEADDYVIARTGTNKLIRRENGWYPDLHRNNRFRVVNTLENLTNEAGYIWTDWFNFTNDDALDFGGVSRPYTRIEYRPNGLQIGDEFIISDESVYNSKVKAVPFENVKAGKIITAFSNTILQDNTSVPNPYRNYATTIAVEPGTILNGKPTAGKIFINFTERFNYRLDGREPSREYFGVDLIQDEFINRAYNDNEISLAKRDELLASPNNLDRQLEAAIIAGNQNQITKINNLKYWTSNGDYIISSKSAIEDPTSSGVQNDGLGRGTRKGRVNRINKKGALSTQTITSSLQWFTITDAWQYARAQFAAVSMLTRGIRWLSDKIIDDGTVVRTEVATNLTATLPMPVVTANKDRTVYASAMFALGNIISATGYSLTSVSNTSLPLFADAKFGDFVKNIKPDVFTATAAFRQNVRTVGIQEDEIVVYIMHIDPIVYLREEVIK